jgi:hypothetical protein
MSLARLAARSLRWRRFGSLLLATRMVTIYMSLRTNKSMPRLGLRQSLGPCGIIDEREAQRRREEVTQQADFYGAMDGASKFVRGDAIAGIIITLVNIAGGGVVDGGGANCHGRGGTVPPARALPALRRPGSRARCSG